VHIEIVMLANYGQRRHCEWTWQSIGPEKSEERARDDNDGEARGCEERHRGGCAGVGGPPNASRVAILGGRRGMCAEDQRQRTRQADILSSMGQPRVQCRCVERMECKASVHVSCVAAGTVAVFLAVAHHRKAEAEPPAMGD